MNQDWVNDWYSLGVTTDVAPGAVVRRRAGQTDLALFNLEGELFARADACGGCGAALSDGKIKDNELECAGCGVRIQIAQANGPTGPALFPLMVVSDEIFAWIENLPESSPK